MRKINVPILFVIVVLFKYQVGLATIGVAEWQLVTPGGYKISHSDPWKAKHGTCLKQENGDKIYISKIDWWQYYEQHIIGKNKAHYFIFNERNQQVILIDSEKRFIKKIHNLGNPISKKMLPYDGWNLIWQYKLAQIRLKERNLDQNHKRMFERTLRQYKGKVYDDGVVIYFLYRND
jgi:hypothetical protein